MPLEGARAPAIDPEMHGRERPPEEVRRRLLLAVDRDARLLRDRLEERGDAEVGRVEEPGRSRQDLRQELGGLLRVALLVELLRLVELALDRLELRLALAERARERLPAPGVLGVGRAHTPVRQGVGEEPL